MIHWKKQGLIFCPDQGFWWSQSHAQLPIADGYINGIFRIYYASRDAQGRSRIGYIETEKDNPQKVVYVHPEPILDLGEAGTFDDNGMMPVALVDRGDVKLLYYAGWNGRTSIPYHNAIGLAISKDQGKTFTRYGQGPIMDRSVHEPFATGTLHIHAEQNIWKAWYQSVIKWALAEGRYEPFYHLKYAESINGIDWNRDGHVAIDLTEEEAGICSATVLQVNNGYCMWYAYRKKGNYRFDPRLSYRIGFATSQDGKNWLRNDERSGIGPSESGWDSEMIAYPNVIVWQDRTYMFYNGNGFGKTGFGFATDQ